ncbi:olfactory receptor 1032-like protein [Camelus ferus]|nr:olfactory receptor 1032-like protein [Camelus ferus]
MLTFTDVTEFILLGLTSRPELQLLFFVVFLLVYIVTLVGNVGMIILIRVHGNWQPLLYGSRVSRIVCIRLISFPYVYGFFISFISTLWTHGLYFCGNIEINHFYCADPALIKMACTGTFIKEYTMLTLAGLNFSYSLLVIIISYIFILIAILRMHSAEGRKKAFSTCGSHLTAVTIFYGTLFFRYLRSPTEESVEQGKVVAVFYTTVVSMLNPMIYNLRNKDVKEAMSKVISRTYLMK